MRLSFKNYINEPSWYAKKDILRNEDKAISDAAWWESMSVGYWNHRIVASCARKRKRGAAEFKTTPLTSNLPRRRTLSVSRFPFFLLINSSRKRLRSCLSWNVRLKFTLTPWKRASLRKLLTFLVALSCHGESEKNHFISRTVELIQYILGFVGISDSSLSSGTPDKTMLLSLSFFICSWRVRARELTWAATLVWIWYTLCASISVAWVAIIDSSWLTFLS